MPWVERDEYSIAKARLCIISGEADAALGALDAMLVEARRQRRTRSALRAETLRVLALAGQGQDDAAAQALLGVIEQVRGEGEPRLFIDEGAAMADRLRDLVRRRSLGHVSPAAQEYVADLLTGFGGATSSEVKSAFQAGLTSRERDVLRALAHGGSNKMIARVLDLNENAVKFHLKNIFRKLGVATRGMAVSVAQKRELLG